jgi:hypothetical protein
VRSGCGVLAFCIADAVDVLAPGNGLSLGTQRGPPAHPVRPPCSGLPDPSLNHEGLGSPATDPQRPVRSISCVHVDFLGGRPSAPACALEARPRSLRDADPVFRRRRGLRFTRDVHRAHTDTDARQELARILRDRRLYATRAGLVVGSPGAPQGILPGRVAKPPSGRRLHGGGLHRIMRIVAPGYTFASTTASARHHSVPAPDSGWRARVRDEGAAEG